MKKFVVERDLPGAGDLSLEELQAISHVSCDVMNHLGKPYHWVKSYITGNKIYCIHIAESEEVVRQHAMMPKIPIKTIADVTAIIDPVTSNPLS